jgi:hypothetical protein
VADKCGVLSYLHYGFLLALRSAIYKATRHIWTENPVIQDLVESVSILSKYKLWSYSADLDIFCVPTEEALKIIAPLFAEDNDEDEESLDAFVWDGIMEEGGGESLISMMLNEDQMMVTGSHLSFENE